MTKNTHTLVRLIRSIWKKSQAISVAAWARTNARHVWTVARCGTGGIRFARRILRIVLAAHTMTETTQLALEPRVATGRVLACEPDDQGHKFAGDRRPPDPAGVFRHFHRTSRQCQSSTDTRRDEPAPARLGGQQPDQRCEHRPVRPAQSRRTAGAAKTGDLVAQHQDLDVLRRRRAPKQHQPARETREHEIQQSDRHGRTESHTPHARTSSPRPRTRSRAKGLVSQPGDVSEPHGAA